jgi:hypothetical protein
MNLKGSGFGLIEELLRHLPARTEENLSQDIWCSGRNSNRASPEYKSRTLPLVDLQDVSSYNDTLKVGLTT